MPRYVQMFNKDQNSGKCAEQFIFDKVLQPNGFALKYIEDNSTLKGRRPEGYITDLRQNKIAVVEIKYLGELNHELHDRRVLDDIKKAVSNARFLGGGFYSVRANAEIRKEEVAQFRNNLKKTLHGFCAPDSNMDLLLECDGIQLNFSRVSEMSTWEYGCGGPGRVRCIFGHKKIQSAIDNAKQQFKQSTLDHTLPKILFLFIDSGLIKADSFISGIVGMSQNVFQSSTGNVYSTREGYHNRPLRHEFVSGEISGIVAVVPWSDDSGFHIWIAESEYGSQRFPGVLIRGHVIDAHVVVSREGIRDLWAEKQKAHQNAGEATT